MNEIVLEMKDITKRFPGVLALDRVSLEVRRGEVHALMGENGAGKSTLMKVLVGIEQPEGGEIFIDGEKISHLTVEKSQTLGINIVYQELNLIPHMSVAENIYIGNYPLTKHKNVDWKTLNGKAQELLDSLGIDIDAVSPVYRLSTALQQMVCIARAISHECKVLVLDEPTSSLDDREVNQLFTIVRKLKNQGVGIIFITHRLDEVYRITDRITVLKDGKYVGTYETEQLSKEDLITHMVGRKIDNTVKAVNTERCFGEGDYILEVRNIAKLPKVRNVSFGVHKGEILGITGLLGSGRSETAELIFGCEVPEKGFIKYKGEKTGYFTPVKAVKKGMAFCTEDRREKGIIPNMSVRNNIAIASLKNLSDGILINNARRNQMAEKYINAFDIKTPTLDQSVKYLSGGNQQKTILARWIASQPDLIILDEPTRGIDVGAKQEIEHLVRKLNNAGISIIYISSEIDELIRNCHRVVVFSNGETVGELSGPEITEANIMKILANGRKGETQIEAQQGKSI